METRHPVEGYFGTEFPDICNHCGVMAVWSRKTLKFVEGFLHFLRKTTRYGKTFIILPKVYIASPIDVVVFKFRKISQTGNRWNMRYLPDKKNRLPVKMSVLCGSRPKSARASPLQCMYSECCTFLPNRLTLGGVIAERVNTDKSRLNWIQYSVKAIASNSFQPNKNLMYFWKFGYFYRQHLLM